MLWHSARNVGPIIFGPKNTDYNKGCTNPISGFNIGPNIEKKNTWIGYWKSSLIHIKLNDRNNPAMLLCTTVLLCAQNTWHFCQLGAAERYENIDFL